MNWLITLKNNNENSLWHSCVYTNFFHSTNQHVCTGKPVEGPAGHTSRSPPAQEQLLRSVELSQASGGVGGPALAEPQPQGGCLWYTGNATDYFLGGKEKKKKNEVLLFPLFSSAGSSRELPTTDCQLRGTLPTGKLLCVLYGWRCIFCCCSVHYVLLFVLR